MVNLDIFTEMIFCSLQTDCLFLVTSICRLPSECTKCTSELEGTHFLKAKIKDVLSKAGTRCALINVPLKKFKSIYNLS